ncbi:piggyBac transposable element-derived protein 4 [Trichonephila clavipes]|nr:piggyBac transposable element-derived protein 4 [Trichonephila clavipes]
MPRKGITIPEALEVFHNLPSDIESDESSLSEAEDVMTAKSSSTINMVMGIKQLPSYRDFWSTNEILHDAFVSGLMPVRKFIWILGNIHLNDNNLMPKKSEKNFDKLYKVRPLLDHLSEMFLKVFKPGQKQSIEESMIKFKGRSSLKQYIPKKPIKRGYKV